MTNREFIENILKSHGAKVIHMPGKFGMPYSAVYLKRLDSSVVCIFWEPGHAEFWAWGEKFWQMPWKDLCSPSWSEESFMAELTGRLKDLMRPGGRL